MICNKLDNNIDFKKTPIIYYNQFNNIKLDNNNNNNELTKDNIEYCWKLLENDESILNIKFIIGNIPQNKKEIDISAIVEVCHIYNGIVV